MEMLVVMALSAIIVGLAFSVMNLVSASCSKIAENYGLSNEEQLAVNRLMIDFNRHNGNRLTNSEIYFFSPIDTARYHLENHVLVQKLEGRIDTVVNNVKKVAFFYRGDSLSNGYFDAFKIEFDDHYFFVDRPNTKEEKFRYENRNQ